MTARYAINEVFWGILDITVLQIHYTIMQLGEIWDATVLHAHYTNMKSWKNKIIVHCSRCTLSILSYFTHVLPYNTAVLIRTV